MKDTEKKGPIFIVGAPRSGTTLLTSYLASHENIVSGPETQFFNKIGLGSAKLNKALTEKDWPNLATNLIASRLYLSGQNVLALYGKTEAEVHAYLSERTPSLKSMLEAIIARDDCQKTQRWLEKTPNHINHIDSIFNSFPNANIIVMHRDFRDSACSMRKLPWSSESVLQNAALIANWFSNIEEFKTNSRVYFQSYERLVSDPSTELKKIFQFIGERYNVELLNRQGASAVTTDAEPWKQDVYGRVDTSNISKWKNTLKGELLFHTENVLEDVLQTYGYKSKQGNKLSKLHLTRVSNQPLKGLDLYAKELNSKSLVISCDESSRNSILIYLENGYRFKGYCKAVFIMLTKRSKVTFLGSYF